MADAQIQRFDTWRSSGNEDIESLLGAGRQISHLAGVNLKPKGRWKKEGSSSVARFSAEPKPLKWKGTSGWERVTVAIRQDGRSHSFIVMVDGAPVSIGPDKDWLPVRKSLAAMEKAAAKLKKEAHHDR